MTKVQMTITVELEHQKYIQNLAAREYEGNESMAIRKIITDHLLLVNDKKIDELIKEVDKLWSGPLFLVPLFA